jgi:molecular chaperone GrpE
MNSPDVKDAPDNTVPETAQSPQPPASDLLAQAKKEAAENYERFLRASADLENLRKRTVREKEELRLYSASRLLEDLLPSLDNLGLGLEAAKLPNADLKSLSGGVELVQQQLKAALANHGLKEINPVGLAFDPHQHEAIAHMPSEDVAAESVLKVVRTGYTLNGRLLRPASVVVSSGKPDGEPKS